MRGIQNKHFTMKRKKSPTNSPSYSHFTLISGLWRRRKITFPTTKSLRPTPSRARETLFNWLANDIFDKNCLDLFTGSGALGMECLSRGAEHCTFMDAEPLVCRTIEGNLKQLGDTRSTTFAGALPDTLKQLPCDKPFDLIFIDPPYGNTALINECLDTLFKRQLIADNAWIYIETAKTDPAPQIDSSLKLHREKQFGQVRSLLFTVMRPVVV